MAGKGNTIFPIQSTAGAILVTNDKGKHSMEKVKVHRYVSGKRPEYAPQSSSEEESEDEGFIPPPPPGVKIKEEVEEIVYPEIDLSEAAKYDSRLRRLQRMDEERSRYGIEDPEILDDGEEERPGRRHDPDSDEEEVEADEDEIEKRRAFLRQRGLEKNDEELLMKEEEKESGSEESDSEYEEYTDSEEEARPRMKPVFVKKRDRVTVNKEMEEKERAETERINRRNDERRKETLKIVEEEIRRERGGADTEKDASNTVAKLTDVNTDDENEEAEYEAWKLRELKRIKRDRDERDLIEKERQEIDRIHSLTEEERRAELKLKPKLVSNKAQKGKYKFLQKYYHRGVFYLDKEDEVFKRDYSAPTLEDHFDKTILPKVMQVKNFGRSGRTKYTHLVDQDTTSFDSAWVSETTQNLKFHSTQAAGVKQVFEKPSSKKRKMDTD